MSASISKMRNDSAAGDLSTTNKSPFDLEPSVSAATEMIKTVIKQQAGEYAQAERIRTDSALEKEFVTKRSERQKQFDAETETEERDRILAYLKPKLTKETYESVLSELGLSNCMSLVNEKPTHNDLTSESSSDKGCCDDPSANQEEVQSSTSKGVLVEDILEGKITVGEAPNETSSANSGKVNQAEMAGTEDGDGDRASHDSLAAPSTPSSSTSNAGAADDCSSALNKLNACTSPCTTAANVATGIEDSLVAPATPDNATFNNGASDEDSSSAPDSSTKSTAPGTPTTRASTTYNSSPPEKPNFTETANATNTSPAPEKPDPTESEHKAIFAKFSSQAQASGLGSQTGSKFGSSSSPFNTHIARQSLPRFSAGQAFVSATPNPFASCAAAQSISFGSGPDGGILGGSCAEQDDSFKKPEGDIAGGNKKRAYRDVSRDDDNSDEPSHKRARTDGGSNTTAAAGDAANTKIEDSTGTSTQTGPASNAPQYVSKKYPSMAARKLPFADYGPITNANNFAALSRAPHKFFRAGGTPLPHGQKVLKNEDTIYGQDTLNTEDTFNSQDAPNSEDKYTDEGEGTTDVPDSTGLDSVDNGENEEIL